MGDYYETRKRSDPEPEVSREWGGIVVIWVAGLVMLLLSLGG